jgi:hypothetical protein
VSFQIKIWVFQNKETVKKAVGLGGLAERSTDGS